MNTHIIVGRNVHHVLQDACWAVEVSGIREQTRNGMVQSLPGPVMVEYKQPNERVLIWPERKANPYFHLFEALWMLAGRQDVKWVGDFNPRMAEFSDDGHTLGGAYGHRWRHHFGLDQIKLVINTLREATSRRAVIAMWDPMEDLWYEEKKDIPCNTHIYFRIINGRLDMTVCNRSNDLIWGMCGSNVVHFSMLHELLANATGTALGRYFHLSNNLHIYDAVPKRELYRKPIIEDPYTSRNGVVASPLITSGWRDWLNDCERFVEDPMADCQDPFFKGVAKPMYDAWVAHGDEPLAQCRAEDWKRAGSQYFAGTSGTEML